MQDGIIALYQVVADSREEAQRRAQDIAIEQTVEVTEALCERVFDRTVASVEGIFEVGPSRWLVRISFPASVLSHEIPQVFSCLYGNISMKPGIRLLDISLCPDFARAFGGPRHGIEGVRRLVGAKDRPLLASAIKPIGLCVSELASFAHDLALGGIDIIKDDHGIANQAICPFEARVEACSEAVAKANAATGRKTLYCPTVTGPADQLIRRAERARDLGAGGLLLSPLVAGLDSMRAVSEATGLPVIAHPALSGVFFSSADHGIAPECLLGTIMRLAGADMVIFPGFGGRFPVGRDTCAKISQALRAELSFLAPAFPMPAGGMTLERLSELLDVFGKDVVFLIGSALYERSPDLVANARYFRSLVL